MTRWFERRPGSEETLLALYDAVGASEELDLEEQAHSEAVGWGGIDLSADLIDSTEVAIDEHEHVTMAQAIGIIEHLLGGRPTSDGGEPAS